MKRYLLIMMFLIISFSVSAQECKYTETEKYQKEVKHWFQDDDDLGTGVELYDLSSETFRLINRFDFSVNVSVTWLSRTRGERGIGTELSPGEIYYFHIENEEIRFETIELTLKSHPSIGLRTIYEWDERDACKKCPQYSNLDCLNDGVASDTDDRCGSGRRINGICRSNYTIGDGICSIEFGENCANSPSDCAPGPNQICVNGKLTNDCSNPPTGMACCGTNFKQIGGISLRSPCGCDFECAEGNCFQGICQRILEPKLRCPSGTNIEKGKSIICNIYASNTKLDNDVKVTFELDAGSGLTFSSSHGCMNIVGSQCIGTYDIAQLSNRGIDVELNGLTFGDSNIDGRITYSYDGKKQTSTVTTDFEKIHIFGCGDGIKDLGETKYNCCLDVGVELYKFTNFAYEVCEGTTPRNKLNWWIIGLLATSLLSIALFFGRSFLAQLTLLSEAEAKRIVAKINHIQALINQKEKEKEIDERHLRQLQSEKRAEDEIKIVKARIEQTIRDIEQARKELEEHEKNIIQDYEARYNAKFIIENGYLRFANSKINPEKKGSFFHRWFFEKHHGRKIKPNHEIHHKNSNKLDNRLENLEEKHKKDHRPLHGD